MSPCKSEGDNVESGRKEEGVSDKEGVCDLTTSLTHLSLQDNIKDIIQLEHHLASINLLDTQVKDLKECKNEEEEAKKEKQDESDEENEKQDVDDETDTKTKEKKDDTEEEQPEDVEEGKKEETEETEQKKTFDDKPVLAVVKEKAEEEKEKEEEKEDEESDDENPTDEEEKSNESQTKSTRLRSRGFVNGVCHGYSPRPYMDYAGASAYHQQPSQCQMSPQQYHGWYGNTTSQLDSLDSLSAQSLIPSVAENSPTSSCASVEGDTGALNTLGYEADSPRYYDDNRYTCNSPQYQTQSSPYYQGLASTPQNQDSPLYQHQDSPQSLYQHQDSPFYQHQDSPQSHYQHQDSPQSLYRHQDSPLYQQQDSPQSLYQHQENAQPLYQHQDSPPVQHYPYQSQYSELLFQDSFLPTPPHPSMNNTSSSSLRQNSFPQSLLTPPVSPQPPSTPAPKPTSPPDEELVCWVINSVMEKGDVYVSPHDRTIIEIKKNLMAIGNCSSDNIEDDLNERIYEAYYKECAKMENEALVNPDDDGDILYMKAACTDQCSKDYKEKLVAFTKRVEMMDLCCDRIVNWKEKRCQKCGNKDPQLFYSPLSWINNHDEMLLSNLVILQFPLLVVEYITRKIMKRPMDLKRTFILHGELFCKQAELYPCLKEGLSKVK